MARFTGVDPIIDQFPDLSPFNYASNNPVLNIDIWGLQGKSSNSEEVQQANLLHSVVFFQYEGRAALGATGAVAVGGMFDTQGNAGIYTTVSGGLGLALGANTGWSAGVATAENINDLSGWGTNVGAYAAAGFNLGFATALEINFALNTSHPSSEKSLSEATFEDANNIFDIGITFGLPVQFGNFGTFVGIYGDVSYTFMGPQGNAVEILNLLVDEVENTFSINVTDKNRQDISNYLEALLKNLRELRNQSDVNDDEESENRN